MEKGKLSQIVLKQVDIYMEKKWKLLVIPHIIPTINLKSNIHIDI